MKLIALLMICLLSWWLTPEVGRLSWRIGAIDTPRDWRRMHKTSIPRGGGIALFLSVAVGFYWLPSSDFSLVSAALVGGMLVFCVGLADDIWCLRAWIKLLVQLAAAVLAVLLYGKLDGFSSVFALLWIVALTNAHNFIDGLDGLFAGTAVIEALGLTAILFLLGESAYWLPLAVAAACLGFLYYNRAPADIFAGDCGSGSIGFVLAVLSLPTFFAYNWSLGFLAPLFLFAYPLTDLATAVLRRAVRLQSPFAPDRAHLHHRLCATGRTPRVCTRILWLLSFSLSALGVTLADEAGIPSALTAVLLCMLVLIGTRLFLTHFAKSG